MYATIGTATELLTQKVLGASTGLFSKQGSFEKTIGKGLQKIITSKKINDIIFDESIKNANEFIEDGNQIVINPGSEMAIENIVIHEVTHSISTQKMKDLVID